MMPTERTHNGAHFTWRENNGEAALFDCGVFITKFGGTVLSYKDRQTVFSQGDPALSVFYVVHGSVKLSVVSEQGKEGVLALFGPGEFFGEECLDGCRSRSSTVAATSNCEIARFDKDTFTQALSADLDFAKYFLGFVLHRNQKLQADLIDQLFNSSEKRLARILLTLANNGFSDRAAEISVPLTQETLANMVGTTRSRISQFMTKFRKLGYIEYDERIKVHNALLNIILGAPSDDGGPALER